VLDAYVIGGGAAPVALHPVGTGRGVALAAGMAALRDAGCTFQHIDAFIAGVASPESPRAPAVAKQFGLTGLPVQQVMNASASGLSAIHSGLLAIESGRHDLVLIIGYDVPEREAPNSIAAQGYQPPITLFAQWAQRRMLEVGTKPEHLAMIAAKNWNYARSNPYAARRSDHEVSVAEVLGSRMAASPLTNMMCTPWVYGAAAVVLASAEGIKKLGRTGVVAKIRASEFQSEVYGAHHIFENAIVGPSDMTVSTARAAMNAATIEPKDIDVVQVHDAFAIEELVYMELLGFSKPGETEELVERGAFGPGSRARFKLPEFSTDGGLIGRGHPGGPTGVFQHIETLRRFRASESDRMGLCHMLGAGSVCIVQVVERVEL